MIRLAVVRLLSLLAPSKKVVPTLIFRLPLYYGFAILFASTGNKVPRDEKPKTSKGELKMRMLEVAERKGDIPDLIRYLENYTYILKTYDCVGKDVSGKDFAEKIRHTHYTGEDTPEGLRNALMADVAEKYVISVNVKWSGAGSFKLPEALAGSLAA